MNREFKQGDRVKYTSGQHYESSSNPLWNGKYGQIVGTVTSLDIRNGMFNVLWDNKHSNCYYSKDLELYKKEYKSHPLTNFFTLT